MCIFDQCREEESKGEDKTAIGHLQAVAYFCKAIQGPQDGKVDARKLHQSGKVPLTESVKSKAPRKVSTCSVCKQLGHRSNSCRMPPETKRPNIEHCDIDIDRMYLADLMGIKPAKRHKQLDLVSFNDWI